MTQHLEEGTLHELLDGEISSADLPPIQAHLAACAECRVRLEEARGFLAAADGLVETLDEAAPAATTRLSLPVLPYRMSWPRRVAWAATIVVAAGLGYAARGGLPPVPSIEERSADTARPADQTALRDAAVPPPAEAAKSQPAPTPAPAPLPHPTVTPLQGAREPVARQDAGNRPQLNEAVEAEPQKAPAVATRRMAVQAPDTISFEAAMRRMSGKLRFIDGLVPARFEAVGDEVRVVYSGAQGELLLLQRLVEGRVTFSLRAPAGFPVDSLSRLRARVRE